MGTRHGTCSRTEYSGLWDSITVEQPTKEMLIMQARARVLCLQCPLLEACEDYLSACEQEGLAVDGVIAGRFSDVYAGNWQLEHQIQSHCLGCQTHMLPQKVPPRRDPEQFRSLRRKHVGEGLCDQCYPALSRRASLGACAE